MPVDSQDPALSGRGHAERDHARHRGDPVELSDLVEGGIEDDVGTLFVDRPGSKRLDLGIQ